MPSMSAALALEQFAVRPARSWRGSTRHTRIRPSFVRGVTPSMTEGHPDGRSCASFARAAVDTGRHDPARRTLRSSRFPQSAGLARSRATREVSARGLRARSNRSMLSPAALGPAGPPSGIPGCILCVRLHPEGPDWPAKRCARMAPAIRRTRTGLGGRVLGLRFCAGAGLQSLELRSGVQDDMAPSRWDACSTRDTQRQVNARDTCPGYAAIRDALRFKDGTARTSPCARRRLRSGSSTGSSRCGATSSADPRSAATRDRRTGHRAARCG